MIYPPIIPPIPESNNATMPNTISFNIFGSSSRCITKYTQQHAQHKKSIHKAADRSQNHKCVSYPTHEQQPQDKEKNKGEATGNKKQRIAQRTAEKASFTLAS